MGSGDAPGAPGEEDWLSPRRPSAGFPGPGSPGLSRRGRAALRVAVGFVAVLVVAGFIAARWVVPYYAVTPGTALNVGKLISVPRDVAHTHRGSVVLTDVSLIHLTALGYLYYRFEEHAEIDSAAELTGGATSAAYDEQGVVEMATARQSATLVALRELGFHPRAVPSGVVVFSDLPGAASAMTLPVGDVITAVGPTRTASLGSLVAAIGAVAPGRSTKLTFHKLGSGTSQTRSLVVGELRSSGPSSATVYTCAGVGSTTGRLVRRKGHTTSCLPVYGEQLYTDTNEPFRVSINADGIVGPSAGLSFALGLIEKLDRADLTGGRRIAATGTIVNNGSVGEIGGIAQKAIAVREAGATVFLVPRGNAAAARANAGPDLRIIAVASIGQAVSALERLGGRLVPAPGAR
ncbi:MAG: S16 family serine protease [Acidimicrobiales bacterium]